jgi:hypothetical protein
MEINSTSNLIAFEISGTYPDVKIFKFQSGVSATDLLGNLTEEVILVPAGTPITEEYVSQYVETNKNQNY